MNRKFLPIALLCSLLLTILHLSPSQGAESHQGGQIRVKWSTESMFLKPGMSLEQEFTPTELGGMVDGAPFRWSNQYHWDFCWQGSSSLLYGGNRCGYVGFGLGSKSGNTYYGNFDFAIFNGLEFQNISSDSRLTCNKSSENGVINNTKTFYVNCWHPIAIQMNTTYVLRVQSANDPSVSGENWWSATLINKKTGESVTIGRIKAFANEINTQIASLETVVFYDGDKKECDAVPVMDLTTSPLTSSSGTKIGVQPARRTASR